MNKIAILNKRIEAIKQELLTTSETETEDLLDEWSDLTQEIELEEYRQENE